MQGDRYEAQGVQAETEPGSRRRVLRNLLGIRSVREMNRLEYEALLSATNRLIDQTTTGKRFRAEDIRHMHRVWLGEIQAAMDRNYEPITAVFRKVIERTLRSARG